MLKSILTGAALCLAANSVSAATVHVFLLIGQSNMVGRDATPFDFAENPRVLNFTDGRGGSALNQIETASDPLRHDKDGVTYGTNPGRPFANTLLPHLPQGDKILLVNRAWGGTPIVDWNKNHGAKGYSLSSGYNLPTNLYQTALSDYKAALEAVKKSGDRPEQGGILWLQGESDIDNLTSPDMFQAAVVDVLTQLRRDLDAPDLKIVIGEIYQSYGGNTGSLIRKRLPVIAQQLHAGFAVSTGAKVLSDGVHMTTASHAKLGQRMAEAYLKLK